MTNTIRRFASDEVAGAAVIARVGNTTGETVTDTEGYFHLDLPRDVSDGGDLFWSSAQIQVADGNNQGSDPDRQASKTWLRGSRSVTVCGEGIVPFRFRRGWFHLQASLESDIG